MCIPQSRLNALVAKQLGDFVNVYSLLYKSRCEGMSQIMKPAVVNSRFSDSFPEVLFELVGTDPVAICKSALNIDPPSVSKNDPSDVDIFILITSS